MKLRSLTVCIAFALAACGGTPVRSTGTYTVRSGDTLYSIATRFDLDYRELARWNGIGRDYRIYAGQVLQLRSGTRAAVPPRVAAAPKPPAVPPAPTFQWAWPAVGLGVISTMRPNGGLGLSIKGRENQDIYAAGPGKVVYSGTGLLGYGQLLIIKHDDTYLSAYGYTHTVLVSEDALVKGGQKVATMGTDPTGVPLLYFEIRVNGKPIDPLLLLPRQP